MPALRIGTRGSALARAQAASVAALLDRGDPDLQLELVVIGVSGDDNAGEVRDAPTDKRRWVDRIEQALQDERIDLAVHSAKDVPRELGRGLALVGAPAREDARDALCGAAGLHQLAAGLDQLAAGARVGTGSARRAAQLRAWREDLQVEPARGNVDTRLRRLAEGRFDAILLALAGLRRLGREAETGAVLDAEEFVPAPGQGILALQARVGDELASRAALAISDPSAMAALAAERALVAALQASCHTPLGAHARVDDELLVLSAFVGLPDGSAWLRDRLEGPAREPDELGGRVARRMLAAGGADLLRRAEELAVERS